VHPRNIDSQAQCIHPLHKDSNVRWQRKIHYSSVDNTPGLAQGIRREQRGSSARLDHSILHHSKYIGSNVSERHLPRIHCVYPLDSIRQKNREGLVVRVGPQRRFRQARSSRLAHLRSTLHLFGKSQRIYPHYCDRM